MVPSLRDAGQQAGYSHAYRDASAAQIEADAVFASVKGTVERHLSLMNKGAQVNVRNWLKKLSEQVRRPAVVVHRLASLLPSDRQVEWHVVCRRPMWCGRRIATLTPGC